MPQFNVTVDDGSPLISYSPANAWLMELGEQSSHHSQFLHTTSRQGATATFTFSGTGVWFYGSRDWTYGTYTISVDGRIVTEGNAHDSEPHSQALLGGVSHLRMGQHVAIVTNTGIGTDLDLDALVYETASEDPLQHLRQSYGDLLHTNVLPLSGFPGWTAVSRVRSFFNWVVNSSKHQLTLFAAQTIGRSSQLPAWKPGGGDYLDAFSISNPTLALLPREAPPELEALDNSSIPASSETPPPAILPAPALTAPPKASVSQLVVIGSIAFGATLFLALGVVVLFCWRRRRRRARPKPPALDLPTASSRPIPRVTDGISLPLPPDMDPEKAYGHADVGGGGGGDGEKLFPDEPPRVPMPTWHSHAPATSVGEPPPRRGSEHDRRGSVSSMSSCSSVYSNESARSDAPLVDKRAQRSEQKRSSKSSRSDGSGKRSSRSSKSSHEEIKSRPLITIPSQRDSYALPAPSGSQRMPRKPSLSRPLSRSGKLSLSPIEEDKPSVPRFSGSTLPVPRSDTRGRVRPSVVVPEPPRPGSMASSISDPKSPYSPGIVDFYYDD